MLFHAFCTADDLDGPALCNVPHTCLYSCHFEFFVASHRNWLWLPWEQGDGLEGCVEVHRLWRAKHRKDRKQSCSGGCSVVGTVGQSLRGTDKVNKWAPDFWVSCFFCFLPLYSRSNSREHRMELALAGGNESTLIDHFTNTIQWEKRILQK